MTRLFDTHCHFEHADAEAIAAMLARARAVGVERILAVGGSESLDAGALVAGGLGCPVALGRDRDQAQELESTTVMLPECPSSVQLAAVGEIGLDYHYSPETRSAQLALFAQQLELARARDLPVVIHTRDADDDTLGLLREIPSRGVIHCYTGSTKFARPLLDLGFYVSFSGIVTFKSAEEVRDSARYVPNDRILIETDSPYLAPVPMRGQANEPAFIEHTCRFLAELRGIDPQTFADLTWDNGHRLFALSTIVRPSSSQEGVVNHD